MGGAGQEVLQDQDYEPASYNTSKLLSVFLFHTGASEAIAKAYAHELARHGVCVILITTDIATLNDTAKTISDSHGVEAVLVEADFSRGAMICKSVKDAIEDKDVGFVINCLNLSEDIRTDFHVTPESELCRNLHNSVSAASLITRLVLPGMAEKQRGVVVNISSGRCSKPCARRAVLSASTVRDQIIMS